MKHLPNLYPLRLFLSVMVIIYHIPLISTTLNIPHYNSLPVFFKGELSVYYFFTLSGFLILRLIYAELQKTNTFDFKSFYLRRISRLYPAYYLVLFIGVFVYHFLLPRLGILFDRKYSVSTLVLDYIFFIPNVFKHYYKPGSILIVLWSIGVEEQFYLFIPIFMFIFKRKVVKSISFLLLFLLIFLLVLPDFYTYQNYYFYFIFGGLLSLISLQKKHSIFNNKALHALIYLLFIISFTTDIFETKNIFIYHVFNMVVSGLLISLISDYPIFIIKNTFIDYLGKISYGVYVYHAVVFTVILFLVTKFKPYTYLNHTLFIVLLNLLIITITIWVAHLSFRFFESKFYRNKN